MFYFINYITEFVIYSDASKMINAQEKHPEGPYVRTRQVPTEGSLLLDAHFMHDKLCSNL